MLLKYWQRLVFAVCICAAMFVSSAAKAGEMRIVYPANGLYSIQPKCAPNRELTVQDASTANGANVFLWSINSNWHTQPSHQKWRLTRIGNSQWYKIEAENSGKALNVHNGITQNGTNVSVWPYGGKMHQFRFLDAGGGYYVIQPNIGGSVVLDVNNAGNYDGANVQVWTWNGTPAQRWKLVRRDGGHTQSANTTRSSSGIVGQTKKALCTVNAYQDSALRNRTGNERVDAGDMVTVLQESGNAYFVRYPVSRGFKERWVSKDIFTQQPAPQGGLLYPLKGKNIEWSSGTKTNGQRCDYVAPSGTPLYAPADGEVSFKQSYAVNYNKLASYGNSISFVSDDGEYAVICAHLSSFNGVALRYTSSLSYPCSASKYKCKTIILATRHVRKGELLGYTGMTGNASGPHVHIEVKQNGRGAVDPKAVFSVWN